MLTIEVLQKEIDRILDKKETTARDLASVAILRRAVITVNNLK